MTPEELDTMLKADEVKVEESAEKLALKTKNELLAESQRIYHAAISAENRLPAWKKWAIAAAAALVIAFVICLVKSHA